MLLVCYVILSHPSLRHPTNSTRRPFVIETVPLLPRHPPMGQSPPLQPPLWSLLMLVLPMTSPHFSTNVTATVDVNPPHDATVTPHHRPHHPSSTVTSLSPPPPPPLSRHRQLRFDKKNPFWHRSIAGEGRRLWCMSRTRISVSVLLISMKPLWCFC
jgi:hypothetical protein